MKRSERVRELGCVVCRNLGWGETPAAVHHALTGRGGRKDETKLLPLCFTHHQGSMGIHTLSRRTWQERYGTETELLKQIAEELGEVQNLD